MWTSFQNIYSRDDCTFREQVMPDGYNTYVSDRHGALLSMGNHRQRLQGRDQGIPALAQFLPRISTLDQTSSPALKVLHHRGPGTAQPEEPADTMGTFGKLSQIIHSPSFHKRWRSNIVMLINRCVDRHASVLRHVVEAGPAAGPAWLEAGRLLLPAVTSDRAVKSPAGWRMISILRSSSHNSIN